MFYVIYVTSSGSCSKKSTKMKLVREHIVAARGMLQLSQADLAEIAGVSKDTIQFFESGRTATLRDETLWRIQTALEERGIIFTNGDSPGVKLDRSKAKSRRAESH